jgi:hypothetical protein
MPVADQRALGAHEGRPKDLAAIDEIERAEAAARKELSTLVRT